MVQCFDADRFLQYRAMLLIHQRWRLISVSRKHAKDGSAPADSLTEMENDIPGSSTDEICEMSLFGAGPARDREDDRPRLLSES